ncbi:MAG: hypothetical protein RL268_67 [Pseudomonadota bacterium]|jgi:hypothetical protein
MTDIIQQPALIIGLTGLAGSGKDTVANLLCDSWEASGSKSVITAFAQPIRAMCRDFLLHAGVQDPDRYLFDRQLKETVIPEVGVSYRHLAQTLGTEWGQQCIGRDVWIRLLDQRLKAFCRDWKMTHFVIPDVRFKVEADWVRRQGGVIWRVERPGVAPVREHVSEQGTIYVKSDRVIENTGTLDELHSQVGAELARLHYDRGLLA